jgi:hypothetical protein
VETIAFVRAIHFAGILVPPAILAFQTVIARPAWKKSGETGSLILAAMEKSLLWVALAGAVAALVSGLAWLFLVASKMSDEALDFRIFETILTETHFGKTWSLHLTLIFLLCGFFGLLLGQKTGSESLPGALVGRSRGVGFHAVRWSCRRDKPSRDRHNSGFTSSASRLVLACRYFPNGNLRRQAAQISGVERCGISNDRAVFANEPHQRSYIGPDRLAQFLADYWKFFPISKRLRTNLARENHRIWNDGWHRGSKPLENQTSVSLFTARNPKRCNHVASERVYGKLSGLRRLDLDRHSRTNVSQMTALVLRIRVASPSFRNTITQLFACLRGD